MRKLFFFFAAILFSACSSYQYVNIDVLTPSDYQIPSTTDSVILLNNSKEQASNEGHITTNKYISYNTITEREIRKDNIKVDSTTSIALYNMYNYLDESMLFSSIKIGRKEAEPRIFALNIDNTLQQYEADALIILESLKYNDILRNINYYGNEANEIEVNTQSEWLIYYADNPYHPYRFTVKDTLYWESYATSRTNCVEEAIWNNAKLAAKQIIPHWISVNRIYYTGFNYIYNSIDDAIEKQDWESAAKHWMDLYNSEKKNTCQKGRMAFNMALFFEMKNDLDTSIMWLGKAIESFTEKNAKSELKLCGLYAKILNKRLSNQKKLNKQYSK